MNGEPTAQGRLKLEPGTLWEKVLAVTQQALEKGALQPISTQCETVEQNGLQFLVRVLPNLARKEKVNHSSKADSKDFDPFLPYEQALFVADISDTHVCLLNKFNVIDHHLLIVTRAFEAQETWLTQQDFEALGACMAEFEGLAFYNGGQTAGASQSHKHLQLVPLPLASAGPPVPIEPAITSGRSKTIAGVEFENGIGAIEQFPFLHAVAELDPLESPLVAAEAMLERYHSLLRAVGLQAKSGETQQTGAYNLLATRRWLLIVPRSQEHFASISVNALGFAGALLVRNQQQMQVLKDQGPLAVLKSVAISESPT